MKNATKIKKWTSSIGSEIHSDKMLHIGIGSSYLVDKLFPDRMKKKKKAHIVKL